MKSWLSLATCVCYTDQNRIKHNTHIIWITKKIQILIFPKSKRSKTWFGYMFVNSLYWTSYQTYDNGIGLYKKLTIFLVEWDLFDQNRSIGCWDISAQRSLWSGRAGLWRILINGIKTNIFYFHDHIPKMLRFRDMRCFCF